MKRVTIVLVTVMFGFGVQTTMAQSTDEQASELIERKNRR